MPVRPQLDYRRHGKNSVHRPERAQIPAPAAPGKEDTKQDRTEGDNENNTPGQVAIVIRIPDDLHPEHQNAQEGHNPTGIFFNEIRRLAGWLDNILQKGARNGKRTDAAPGPGQKKNEKNSSGQPVYQPRVRPRFDSGLSGSKKRNSTVRTKTQPIITWGKRGKKSGWPKMCESSYRGAEYLYSRFAFRLRQAKQDCSGTSIFLGQHNRPADDTRQSVRLPASHSSRKSPGFPNSF